MAANRLRTAINFIPVMLIKFYQRFISPLLPPSCRFYPSCSSYGLQAFKTYPLHKALWLTAYRILRCNPFNPGGYDPLPLPEGHPDCEKRDEAPPEDGEPHRVEP